MTDVQSTVPAGENKHKALFDAMFAAGAHYGATRTKRHPTAAPFIFGKKNRVELFNLEKTAELFLNAMEYVRRLASEGGSMILASSKLEAKGPLVAAAETTGLPSVAGRWIGGTFTNFAEISKRVKTLEELLAGREKGEFAKYTKKERLLLDRKIETLKSLFNGIVSMKELPKALFVIDPKKESIAVVEARKKGVVIVALAGSDCDFSLIDYPIPGNDAAPSSIAYFVSEIARAYGEGKLMRSKIVPAEIPLAKIAL